MALHPYNTTSPNFTGDWDVYLGQQCNQKDGYRGLFCGTCIKGYGMTAPFQCKKCAGKSTQMANGTVSHEPDRGTISGLWVFYWFALAAWYVFTVWTVMRDKSTAPPARLHGRSVTWPRSAKVECAEKEKKPKRDDKAGLLDIAKVRGHSGLGPTGSTFKCVVYRSWPCSPCKPNQTPSMHHCCESLFLSAPMMAHVIIHTLYMYRLWQLGLR